jgi:hypothetical protein
MDGATVMVIGKLVLTLGGLLGFSLWEIHKLRRERKPRD